MGGLAFKELTRRIKRDEVKPTLLWLSKQTGLSLSYISENLLGSGGRSETSGDLDINMDIQVFDKHLILAKLQSVLDADHIKDRLFVNQIFTCVPIGGDPKNGYVQIDFMFGQKEWQAFSYWSPGDTSTYKGLFRTELIKAAVAARSDWTKIEDGELVARVGPTFFHDRGLVWRYRHRAPKKNGIGRVQTLSELSQSDFKQLYPDSKNISHNVINTATGVAEFLLGKSSLDDFHSYETLSECLRQTYSRDHFELVMRLFEERLNSLKVDIPEDIQNEILTATGPTH